MIHPCFLEHKYLDHQLYGKSMRRMLIEHRTRILEDVLFVSTTFQCSAHNPSLNLLLQPISFPFTFIYPPPKVLASVPQNLTDNVPTVVLGHSDCLGSVLHRIVRWTLKRSSTFGSPSQLFVERCHIHHAEQNLSRQSPYFYFTSKRIANF